MNHILLIIILMLLQALVFGRIHVMGAATPLVYLYFALQMPRNMPRGLSILMCFMLGMGVDIFCNTPGLAAASMTFTGFLQPYVLSLFLSREDEDDFRPSRSTMGFMRYFTYSTMLVLPYCIVFFSLDALSLSPWHEWAIGVAGSYILTMILVMSKEYIKKKR